MKYFKPSKVSRHGNVIVVPLTEAINILGWKIGDKVNVSVPDEHIVIRKFPKEKS